MNNSSNYFRIISTPELDFLTESLEEGGLEQLSDDLNSHWHSSIELKLQNQELIKNIIESRWKVKLAIPVGDFIYALSNLISKAIDGASESQENLAIAHGVEDTLVLKLTKVSNSGYSLQVIDTVAMNILSESIFSLKDLVSTFVEGLVEIKQRLVNYLVENKLIDHPEEAGDYLFPEIKKISSYKI